MFKAISKKTALGGLAAAGVIAVGIAAPTVAFADNNSSAPSSSISTPENSTAKPGQATAALGQATTTPDKPGDEQTPADRRAAWAESLAKELGLPQDKVTTALDKVREQFKAEHKSDNGTKPQDQNKADRQAKLKERLDQAVKDGKLTQDQADAITKAVDAGVLRGWGGWGHGWFGAQPK